MEYLYLDRCSEHAPSLRADPIDYMFLFLFLVILVSIIKDRALFSIRAVGRSGHDPTPTFGKMTEMTEDRKDRDREDGKNGRTGRH